MVNGFPTQIWKRLEHLERALRSRGPRMVVLTVPTGADGVTAETEEALTALKRQHGVSDADDLVIQIAHYGDDLEALPRLVSITST